MDDRLEGQVANSSSVIAGVAYSLRPWQWYKQAIILVPVAFSFRYFDATDIGLWTDVVLGVVVFSLTAGCVYMINDIMDIEEDRRHPRKKHRPIPSGQVSVALAAGVSVPGLVAGPAVGWWLRPAFGAVVGVYVLQNLVYSAGLKDLLFIDLMVIGIGFVLRAIAGVVLVGAPMSPWLILCTFLTALLFGMGKRWTELGAVENGADVRENLDGYSPEILRAMFISVSSMLLVSYSLYTFFVRSDAMMLTIPFALYAVFRYGYLIIERGIEQPERIFLDRPMLVNLVVWGLISLFILYVLPSVPSPPSLSLAVG